MIALLYLVFLHFANAGSGTCHRNSSRPQLGIATGAYGTNVADQVYVRILYGNALPVAQWSNWQDFDTKCDDLDPNKEYWYNIELAGSTEKWLAIAFYSTTTDAVSIRNISFWNGVEQESVNRFCGLIFGPSKVDICIKDYGNGQDTEPLERYDGLCANKVSNDPSYGEFIIDGGSDRDGCSAAAINLGQKRIAGTEYYVSDPGTPSNPGSSSLYSSSRLNKDGMVSILSSYNDTAAVSATLMQLMIVVSIFVISFMCGYCYFKHKYSDSTYKALAEEMI